jgi:virulence factor Mce-like protein
MRAGKLGMMLVLLMTLVANSGCGIFAGSPTTLRAQFEDAVGLYVGNDVTVLGVKVGSVTAVEQAGTHSVVSLRIDPGVKLPATVQAMTVSPSVVTDRRVELTPPYQGGPVLTDGTVIPIERTQTPVEIDRIFATIDKVAQALSQGRDGKPALAGAVDTAATLLDGNGERLHQALLGLSATVGIGADNRDQLLDLIKQADSLTGAAAANDATIRSLSTNVASVVREVDQQGPKIDGLLHDANNLLDRTRHLLDQLQPDVKNTLKNFQVVARTLHERNRDFAEAQDEAPLAFQNLARIASPEHRAARIHLALDKALFDNETQVLICRRLSLPLWCPPPAGRPDPVGHGARTLIDLLSGGGR